MGERKFAGFTLIELLVTVVISAILVAVAVPTYSLMLRKSRRTDAKTALLDIAGLEERYYSTTYAYTNVPTQLGYAGTWSATEGITIGGGYYQILEPEITLAAPAGAGAGTSATSATFSVKAIAKAGSDQAKDTDCASFTVSSTGARTSRNAAGEDTTATCWQ